MSSSAASTATVLRYSLFDLPPAFFTALVAAVRRIEDGDHTLALTAQQAADVATAKPTAAAAAGAEAGLSASALALAITSAAADASKASADDTFPCAACGGEAKSALFANVHEYRAHCKSAWHKHNIKLTGSGSGSGSGSGKVPLSEEEFTEWAADHDADDDVDGSDDDAQHNADAKKPPAKAAHRRRGSKQKTAEDDADADDGDDGDDGAGGSGDDMPSPNADGDDGDGSGGTHTAPRILFFTAQRVVPSSAAAAADGKSKGGKKSKGKAELEPEQQKALQSAAAAAQSASDAKEHVVTVWKNVLFAARPNSLLGYASALRDVHARTKWFVFIAHGGRFAGGVFVGAQCVAHRTVARYTVRKKQGGSQASRDKQGGGVAGSMGSQIRRAQTVKFREDIIALQSEWAEHLRTAHRMFLYTPSTNRQYFFHENCAIAKDDPRVCSIPFALRRPVFAEVQRVHKWMATIEVAPATAVASSAAAGSGAAADKEKAKAKRQASKSPVKDAKTAEAVADAARDAQLAAGTSATGSAASVPLPPTDLLLRAIRDGDDKVVAKLVADRYQRPPPTTKYPIFPTIYFTTACGSPTALRVLLGLPAAPAPAAPSAAAPATAAVASASTAAAASTADSAAGPAGGVAAPAQFNEELEGAGPGGLDEPCPEWHGRTALHRAAADGRADLVWLLLSAGADPTAVGAGGKPQTPYQLCADKKTRQSFSDFAAANPDAWEYADAHIPVKSADDEGKAKAAAADKKRAKKKAQREKEKLKKTAATKAKEEAAAAEAKQKADDAARSELLKAALSRDAKVSGLTDREKRAHAAELRLLAMKGSGAKCDHCAQPLMRVPFERLTYRYCTIQCLQQHKAKLEGGSAAAPPKHI